MAALSTFGVFLAVVVLGPPLIAACLAATWGIDSIQRTGAPSLASFLAVAFVLLWMACVETVAVVGRAGVRHGS